MKKIAVIFICVFFLFCGCGKTAQNLLPQEDDSLIKIEDDTSVNKEDDNMINITESQPPAFLKAAWVATVYNITYPKSPTSSSTVLKREIDDIVTVAADAGLNALFFQVRPAADAFYKSKLFPWSKYLTGTQGKAPDNSFDPLSYIIEQCHKKDIELHAWLNPFRVTAAASDKLIASHPANTSGLTFSKDGKLYFNPGELPARELIVKGILEIIENYDVDGIHFDDYFYPEGITNEDADTFANRLNGINNLADWRRNNIDELIRQTYLAIQAVNPDVAFGVSPSGVWANKSSSNPLGSNTRGFESYNAIYADSRGWVKKGYVDYIAPQIYWYIGQSNCDFKILLDWWAEVCDDTGVALHAGLAGYKQDDSWTNSYELTKQVDLALNKANGIIIYSFNDLFKESVKYAIE